MEGEVCGCRLVCTCFLIGTHHGHMHYDHLVVSALTPPYRRHRSGGGELDLTLHLSDIAHTIGIENVDEVRALILDMVSVLYKDVSRGGPLFMSDVVLDCILGNICEIGRAHV